MGAWLASNVFLAEAGTDVTVIDVEAPVGLSERCALHEVEYLDDRVRGLPDLKLFDLVVVAVPRNAVAQVAQRILAGLAPGTLVIDVVSLKQEPLATIERVLPPDVGLIGTHPLFGTAVPSPVGQTVVVCPTQRTRDDDLTWLCELLMRHGASVPVMTPAEHDEAMAIVQVLTHYTAWTVASALKATNADFRRALTLLTPPFRALAGLVGRIVDIQESGSDGGGARIFADIQTAGYAKAQPLRDAFETAAVRLNELARRRDHEAWRETAEGVAEFFTSEALDSCKQLFAQSHASAQSDALALHRHRKERDVCAFRSTTQGRVVAGRVADFSSTSVTVEVCSASATGPDDRAVYALAVDDETRAAVAALGFTVPSSRLVKLPRGDYALLSSAEFETWRLEDLVPHRRDLTLEVPDGTSGDLVIQIIPRVSPDVLASERISRYEPPDGSRMRWTARLHIRGDRVPQRVLAELQELLSTFGVHTGASGDSG